MEHKCKLQEGKQRNEEERLRELVKAQGELIEILNILMTTQVTDGEYEIYDVKVHKLRARISKLKEKV